MTPPPLPTTLPTKRPSATTLLWALLVGAACYLVSCALVAPTDDPHGFGIQWRDMSERPFELVGQLPHRILTPLLAHVTGCGGDRYVPFTRGLTVLMLAVVCLVARRRGAMWVDALLVTLAVAVTAPVQMYKQHWVGYADPLCYTLFLLAMLAARRPAVFWGLFLLNLLNHELAAFLLPWLWFVRRRAGGDWRHDVLGAGAALALYAAFYLWVRANGPQQLYNADYFLANPLFPGGTFVVWLLAMVHWTVAFGPVLAVLAWHVHGRAHGMERLHFWLVLGSVLVIFCIAFDWARHSNLILLPFVVASVRWLDGSNGRRLAYVGLTAVAVLLFVLVPPWAPDAWPTHAMANIDLLLRTGMVVPNGNNIGFGSLSSAVGQWLPEVWPMLLAIAAILAAIWALGAVSAGRVGSGAPSCPADGRGSVRT
jgi:hypothetical protein